MKRRLFTLAAAGSLLLCIATVALWLWSYDVGYIVGYVHGPMEEQEFCGLGAASGDLAVFWRGPAGYLGRRVWFEQVPADVSSLRPSAKTPLFHLAHHPSKAGSFLLVVPFWSVLLLLMVPPVAWVLARRSNRLSDHACPTCGYDLRATPLRCPECGTAAAE